MSLYAAHSSAHVDLARSTGIEAVLLDVGRDWPSRRFDVTVDASATRDGLAVALRATRPNGVCTSTSGALHRGADTPLPVYDMYMNAVTFRTGWVHTRPNIPAPMDLIGAGTFDPLRIATTVRWSDAAEAFTAPFTKLVLTR